MTTEPTAVIAVDQFRSIFRGRYDDFAEQQETGGYLRIGRVLRNEDIQDHLDGARTIGVYLLDPSDSRCYHTVIDVDTLDKAPRDQLAGALKDMGLADNAIMEFSGKKGYHFWLCYEAPVPAADARALGKAIVAKAGLPANTEVFPKQDMITGDGFGNLVKLPLGLHRVSQKRSKILHPQDVRAVKKIDAKRLKELLSEYAVKYERQQQRASEADSLPNVLPCIAEMWKGVGEGSRDNVAYQLILHLRRSLDQGTAISAMQTWDRRNKPPLGDELIEKKVKQLWKSPAKGFGCDKDYMQPFCNQAICPVYAKAQARKVEQVNGALEDQAALLSNAVPKYGWLWEYVEYAKDTTDAPEVFHLFGGLSALSAVMGRNVYLPFGDGAIYPNTWIVLVAGSSFFHKSTAVAIPTRIVRIVNENLLLPNEFSPEVMVSGLSTQPNGLLVWSEMKSALSMMNRPYMEGTKEMLTELYDCPDVYIRKLKERCYRIEAPALSILGASTIDWLVSGIKQNDIGGGFTARFVFVPAMAKSRDIALPEPTNHQRRNQMATMLKRCADVEGMVDISQIRAMYEEWYYGHVAELQDAPMAQALAGFYSRLSVYTLKFAMLLEVSKTQDTLIQPETLGEAIAITDYLKRSIRYLVEHEFHANREAAEMEKLRRIVENKPGISRRELLRHSHLLTKTFDPVLATLLQNGQLRQSEGRLYASE